MNQPRYQPYIFGRRPYRSYQRSDNPIPPPSTATRINRGNIPNHNVHGIVEDNTPVVEDVVEHVITNELTNQEEDIPVFHDQNISHSTRNQFIRENDSDSSSNASDSDDENSNTSFSSNSSSSEDNSDGNEGPEEWGPTKVPTMEDPLYPNSDCSKFECLLMILNLTLRHGLSQSATEDVCKLINKILRGNYIPTSKFMFRKIFGNTTYHFHFYCRNCELYLGKIHNEQDRIGIFVCEVCDQECKVANMNDGHFFITFPLMEQLKYLLENTGDALNLLEFRWNRNVEADVISDIFDGKVYSELAKEGQFLSNHFNYSLTFAIDGARVHDSTKNTMWPILFRLNEFPLSVRFDTSNTMVAALWFGKTEPSMALFCSTFVKEVQDLYEKGFTWKASGGELVHSKFILLNCVADSKAKPPVQSMKMHSGYWGCGYCYHPGVIYDGSSQAKYPLNDDLIMLNDFSFNYTVNTIDPDLRNELRLERRFEVVDRNNVQLRADMETAETERNERGEVDVKGVKGKSVLFGLLFFDLVFGFVIDYLHNSLLGCSKHVTGLWLNTTSKGKLYYIGPQIKRIDKRLLNIKPPKCISRRPRSLSDRVHWKANEWRSWLLFYSIPCLVRILPSRYLQHHCLLVSALHLLLQKKINRQDLADATNYLGAYCVQFMTLYGKPMMYFNVHLLLHLGKCVALWGPLFCYSAFPFESINGYLVNLVKGSRGVLSQIADKYTRSKAVPKLMRMYNISETTISYCKDLMCYQLCKSAQKFDSVTVLGPLKCFPFKDGEELALRSAEVRVTNNSYERVIIKNILFNARCYTRKGTKSDSSVVKLDSGQYGVIERIIDPAYCQANEPKLLLLLRKINTIRGSVVTHQIGAKAAHIKRCGLIVYGEHMIVKADDVVGIAIIIDCFENTYIADFPNNYEKD